ncbi:MAG: hypothetical protein PW896_00020 [Pseudomonas sp.]|uniref:hypothetical protein n=1 Tax=Pseudomonas sp. TaxID=306 RepID=UPI002398F300|nr:hypothetical protein [Pseudomonas sp.]MDE1193602.1 hypothetical protein [Pseudomonas sp.]
MTIAIPRITNRNQTPKKEHRIKNNRITLTGKRTVRALQEIEFMMISLRKIEDHYFYKEFDSPSQDPDECSRELTRFIRENNFIRRLSVVRSIISEGFDNTLGKDHMDDLERAMEHLVFWENPGD